VVDGNNVVGARPDGWWRDRRGASRRLLARLQCYAGRTGEQIVLFFDVAQPDLPEGDHDGVVVRYAMRGGRNAADERIVEFLDAHVGEPIEVVTSDRALAGDSRLRGAGVTGAGAFLTRLEEAGC
jgi:predicted RNA-binding protein with PIN domain